MKSGIPVLNDGLDLMEFLKICLLCHGYVKQAQNNNKKS